MIKELVEKGNEKLEELVVKHPKVLEIVGGTIGLGVSGIEHYKNIINYGSSYFKDAENYVYPALLIASGYYIGKLLGNKIKNIAELKQDKEKLQLQNSYLDALFENPLVAIALTDNKGHIEKINQSFSKLFGYSLEESSGKNIDELLTTPDLINEAINLTLNTKQNGRTDTDAIRYNKNGVPIEVMILGEHIAVERKQAGLYAFYKDITDRKKAEYELKESNKKLTEANNAKDKMFSIIAHDLKSPFQGILGLAELLVNEYDTFDDTEKIEFIKGIHKKGQEAYQTLEYLLEWARMQMGGVEYKPNYNNLADVVNKNMAGYQLNQKAEDKEIQLVNKIDPNIEAFYDDDLLSRVVVNLVSNAVKFTDNGGKIEIGAKYNGGAVEVYVSDTGKGITKENLDKLWGINFTTHGTNGEKGTGLGLSVCKEFVEMNGGKIYVESEAGKGSKFIFTVPIKDYQANPQQNK